ncbi:elongation factor P [soil metagenome]
MAVVATNIKKGQCIKYNNELGIVLDTEHRTPGKGNAIMLATVRSLSSGKSKTIRFASSDKVDIVPVDRQKLEFSYTDGTGYYFMNPQTFDTVELPGPLLEGSTEYLTENLAVEVLFVEGNPVTVELPASVDLKITEAAEGLRGDTANNPTKPATLESGLVVQVPLFIKPGEVVRIDTSTGKYLGRA